MDREATQFEPTAGEEETATKTEGGTDVSTDKGDTQTDETQSDAGGESDSDGGGADQEVGEDGVEAEGKAGDAQGDEVAQSVSEQIAAVKKEILDAMKGDEGTAGADAKVLDSVSIPSFGPQHLEQIQEKFGFDGNQANFVRELVNHAVKGLVGHMQGELSEMRQDKAFESVSGEKEFSDAKGLKSQAYEFLKDFAPQHRANPVLIRKAVIYARGLNAKAQVKAVAGGAERRTKIIGQTRPAGVSAGKNGAGSVRLTAAQESASRIYPGGRAAYVKAIQARGNGSSFEKRAEG